MTRLLVIDDDDVLRTTLAAALGLMGHQVTQSPDGESGLAAARVGGHDVVVLDLGLPDLDGIEVVRRLREESSVPVLVLTAQTDTESRVRALNAGADDYINKPFSWDELEARLRAVARRPDLKDGPGVLVRDDLVINLGTRQVTRAEQVLHLTPTEWRLLVALARHPGRLTSHTELVQTVWGTGYGEETRLSLRAHLKTLRAKLGDDAAHPRYVHTESGAGYRWVADTTPSAAGPPRSTVSRQLRHELDNALTALGIIAFVVGPRGAEAGVGEEVRTAALERLPEVSDRVRRLVAAVTATGTTDP